MVGRILDHLWLSGRKRDLVDPGLSLRLSVSGISVGVFAFALFCGGLLSALIAVDLEGNGVDVPGVDLRAMRVASYCLIGCGAGGLLVSSFAWLALVRLAHCQIRDQEHLSARSRYMFPEDAIRQQQQRQLQLQLQQEQQQQHRLRDIVDVAKEIVDKQHRTHLQQQQQTGLSSGERLVL